MKDEPITLANRQAQLRKQDATIAYCEQGEKRTAGDPVIVLLHGYCGSSAYWKETLPLLAGIGKIVVPDWRGHGSSSAPDKNVYEMEDLAGDIAELLDELAEEKAVLIGHSLGGYAALAFAERYPEQLAAFGLMHSTGYSDTAEAKANRDKAAANIRENGIGPFVESLVPKLFAPDHLETMAGRVAFAKAIGAAASAEGAAATAIGMKNRPDRRSVIGEASVPVLLLAGSEDGVVPKDKTFTEPASDRVRHVLLEACGHMGMMERPERVAAEIRTFAEEVFSGIEAMK